ncbi:hypothetical protein IZY60_10195 [Lutibacter sp. B2]|nr:hypothetical protein [Lutibacter sp. B2]
MKKKEMGMTIAIAVLLILNIITGYKLREIQNSISKVSSSVNNIDGKINGIYGTVSNTISEVRKEQMWIVDKDYDIINVEDQFKEAKITFNWTFRELGKNEKVYVLYGEENNGEIEKWNKIESTHIAGLNYKTEIDLSYDKNYEFQVVAENANSKKTEKLEKIDLYDQLMNRMYFEEDFQSMNNSEVEVYARIENFYRDLKALKIKSAKVNIYYEEKLLKSIDITEMAEKESPQGDIDKWEYRNTFKFEELFKNINFEESDKVKIQIIAKDYTGREYKSKLEDF